jgi:hypothetical protein
MSNELTPEQTTILQETEPLETISAFKKLQAAIEPECKRMFSTTEIQEPAKQVAVIVTELRALYLQVCLLLSSLKERGVLRDAIQLVATAQHWFGEGLRSGVYRPRPIREVIEASRPWRQKLKLMGRAAFTYNTVLVEQFSDVNSSFTLEEERKDLQVLLSLVKIHEQALTEEAGLTPQFTEEGKALLTEVEQRDLLGVMGLRTQEEALTLRNQLITFAVVFARKVAAKGALAVFDNETERKRFETFTFGGALRRIQERKKSEEKDDTTDEPAKQE